jgi:hypothetical protein
MSDPNELEDLFSEFEKEENERESSKSGRDSRILSLKPNKKPYLLRLIPNVKARQVILRASVYEWKNRAGKYVWGGYSPATFNPKISRESIVYETVRDELYEAGRKDQAQCLFPIPYSLVNVLVVQDPNEPANNGTIKAFRYKSKPRLKEYEGSGSPIHLAIDDQMEEGGAASVFGKSGKTQILRLLVKKGSAGHEYTPEMVDADEEIDYSDFDDQIIDLLELVEKPFSEEKMKETVQTRLLMKRSRRSTFLDDNGDNDVGMDDNDDLPLEGLEDHSEPETSKSETSKSETSKSEVDPEQDSKKEQPASANDEVEDKLNQLMAEWKED